jgi:putative intracellular protease/amidase
MGRWSFSLRYVFYSSPYNVLKRLTPHSQLSNSHKMSLAVIAAQAGPVSSGAPPHGMAPGMPPMDLGHMLQPKFVATHSFRDAPALDVLLVPGGVGNIVLEQTNNTSVEDFIALRFNQVDYLLSVCTGSVSLAKAGVLEGRRATTNKGAWAWVSSQGRNVTWVPTARWVQDGKIWTSSGVSAGMFSLRVQIDHGNLDPSNGFRP